MKRQEKLIHEKDIFDIYSRGRIPQKVKNYSKKAEIVSKAEIGDHYEIRCEVGGGGAHSLQIDKMSVEIFFS